MLSCCQSRGLAPDGVIHNPVASVGGLGHRCDVSPVQLQMESRLIVGGSHTGTPIVYSSRSHIHRIFHPLSSHGPSYAVAISLIALDVHTLRGAVSLATVGSVGIVIGKALTTQVKILSLNGARYGSSRTQIRSLRHIHRHADSIRRRLLARIVGHHSIHPIGAGWHSLPAVSVRGRGSLSKFGGAIVELHFCHRAIGYRSSSHQIDIGKSHHRGIMCGGGQFHSRHRLVSGGGTCKGSHTLRIKSHLKSI